MAGKKMPMGPNGVPLFAPQPKGGKTPVPPAKKGGSHPPPPAKKKGG